MGGSRWNRLSSSFRSNVISTSCFHFRFPLPVPWPMSYYVGSVIPRSGVVKNVRLAVEISFIAATQAYIVIL